MLSKLICLIKGHVRGKKVGSTEGAPVGFVLNVYACPRCGAQWTRKVRS